MRFGIALAGIFVALAAASNAHAQDFMTEGGPVKRTIDPPYPTQPTESWYGYQPLILDVAGDLTVVYGVKYSVLLIALDGPIIHALHGRRAAVVAGSVGLRLGAPFVLGLIGLGIGAASCNAPSDANTDCLLNVVVGLGLGAILGELTAQVIDDFVLSWEPDAPAKPSYSRPASFQWAPSVNVVRTAEQRDVPVFGIRGVF